MSSVSWFFARSSILNEKPTGGVKNPALFIKVFTVRQLNKNGLLPKSLFACLKTFFDKSKARSRRFQNSPFKAQTVEIAYLPLRQDLLAQNVLKTAQRNFYLGNNTLIGNTCVWNCRNGKADCGVLSCDDRTVMLGNWGHP